MTSHPDPNYERIEAILATIGHLSAELRTLVAPTDEETQQLLADLELNPHVYTSQLEDDDLFIAENVWSERETIRLEVVDVTPKEGEHNEGNHQ